MTNPFDAATPAMIECYEANVAYYRSGEAKPNYPMPAIPDDRDPEWYYMMDQVKRLTLENRNLMGTTIQ